MDSSERPTDLDSHDAIVQMVDLFYFRIMNNELLAPYFRNLNWIHHKERMVSFWSFILLHKAGYTRNVYDAHKDLDITHVHFDMWLTVFTETVNAHFTGPMADAAIERARVLALTFSAKKQEQMTSQ
jgi:hemoglobin